MSLALVTDDAAETDRVELMPMLLDIGQRARAAQRAVGLATAQQKSAALRAIAAAIRAAEDDILLANATDLVAANKRGQNAAFIDRLTLTEAGVESIAQSVEDIAALPDPVGRVLASFSRPNGLTIERVATPLGVIGVIFESRPNVTADAGALCLKAGNATILRAGSDSFESAMAIRAAMASGLRAAGLPADAIQLVPTRDRAAVGAGREVDALDGTAEHNEANGPHRTDRITTENKAAAERFLNEVDSAIVLHNASTQFADGGEFGFGAEIGIATGRMHARGPVGIEQLTAFKYRVRGNGQVRA